MDDESGDNDRDELTSEWGAESRHDWRLGRAEFVKMKVLFEESYKSETQVHIKTMNFQFVKRIILTFLFWY